MSGPSDTAGSGPVTICVDGIDLETRAGSTVMEALDRAGWLDGDPRVPSLCWHPSLSVSGNCRLCRVEVIGEGDEATLATACTLPVHAGMVVRTAGERVQAARRAVLEMFLARHPAECAICDRNGDCGLQRSVFRHGPHETRAALPPASQEKHVDLGAGLQLDRTRCVHCERCVRFCDEITGTGELVFTGEGEHLAIACAPNRAVDNAYAQNLAEVCPVGAITHADRRPLHRPWALASTPSVCGGCGRGCNVWVETAGDHVVGYRPRRNDDVNQTWLCDAGRLGAADAERADRVRRASVRGEDGASVDVSIAEAIEEAAGRIAEVVDAKGAGVLAGLASAHLTNEDLFVFRRFLEAIGTDHAAVAVPMGEGDDLLVLPDKAVNARGAVTLGFAPPAALLDRLRGGGLDALITTGHDLLGDALLGDPAVLDRLDTLIVIDTAPSALLRHADVVIPALHRLEKCGTVTNADGRVQRVDPARSPGFPARAEGDVLAELARQLGLDGFAEVWDPAAVSARMSESVAEFAGRHLGSVGDAGLLLVDPGATMKGAGKGGGSE